jgi:chromosome segregation ATPase
MVMDSRVEKADHKAHLDRATDLIGRLQQRLSQAERAVAALETQSVDHEEAIADIRHLMTKLEEKTRQLPTRGEHIGPAEKASLKALVDDVVAEADAKGPRLWQRRTNFQSVWSHFQLAF